MNKTFDKLTRHLEQTTFKSIFLFWLAWMAIIGIVYFVLSFFPSHALTFQGTRLVPDASGFFTAQYFSFITSASASLGYGDVLPHGLSRLFAVIEAVSGLVLFGVVISKLVSAKQEIILDELYDISFDEKVTRLRSALTLFRKDTARLIERVSIRDFVQKDQRDMGIILASLEGNLADVVKLTNPARNDERGIRKSIDQFQLELLLTSVAASYTKMLELLFRLDNLGVRWRQQYVSDRLTSINDLGQSLVVHQRKQKMSPKLGLLVDEVEKLIGDLGYIQEHEKIKNTPLAQWV